MCVCVCMCDKKIRKNMHSKELKMVEKIVLQKYESKNSYKKRRNRYIVL